MTSIDKILCRPRKIGPKLLIHDIDEEFRRRKNSQKKNYVEIANPKGRHGGRQDLTDIPTNTPWQQIWLDQTGQALPINTNYHCLKCGYEYSSSFPPDKCFKCGFESPLYNKKVVKLKK